MIEKDVDVMSNIDYSATDILYMLRDLPDACCIFKIVTDPFGTVKDMLFLFANEKYASLVGKPTGELIGATYFNTVTNRDEDWIRLSYQAAYMRQSVISRTYNTQFNKWFEFWAVPVYQKGFCAFIIHDVTAEKRKEESREIMTNSNNFIINCAKVLSSNDFKKGIRHTLRELGTVLKADRVSIIESLHGEIGEFHEWTDRRSGSGLPSKKIFEEMDFFTMWERQLDGNNIIICEDTSVIQDKNKEVYKTVLEGIISRYILAALKDKNETIGYLLIDNYSMEADISIKDVVESMAIFISEELRNDRLVREMIYMSSHDELTELSNRHSYNSAIHMINGMDVSLGICFVDINGLKFVNDNEGHENGDSLIKETANAIAQVFKKKYCYRIGGDEFVALIPQIDKEHFESLVDKMRKKANKIPIAVGAIWADQAGDINSLINEADKLMYADKAAFYSEHERRHV